MKTRLAARRFLGLIPAGLLLWPAMGQAQAPPPGTLVLTQSDNGTIAGAVVGQPIQVDLHGNLTTGYAWVLDRISSDSVLTNGPMVYTQDSGGGVGVGGTFSFPFLAAKPGDATLALEYRPPGGGPPAQTFSVTIRVTAPPRLGIKRVGSNVVIWWPIAGSANFFLEGAATLSPPSWAALNVLPLPDGANYTVTLGSGGAALYFRLHRL